VQRSRGRTWIADDAKLRQLGGSAVVVFILVFVGVWMKRVVRAEEEVTQAEGRVLVSEGRSFSAGESLEVYGFLSQNVVERFTPGGVSAHGMGGILSDSFDGEAEKVNAVARGEVELELVRLLEEFNSQGEEGVFGERQVIF
jgi:hypothetical protein